MDGSSVLTHIAIALLVVLVVKLIHSHRNSTTSTPYPPGPKPLFLIGNALDFPKADAAREYVHWGRKFNSDILHATAFGIHLIVVNNRKIADDLFETRANIYSDRPISPVAGLAGWDSNIGFLSYGAAWRQQRKICQQNFHSDAAKQYLPIMLERVHYFLHDIVEKPAEIFEHCSYLSISTPMRMMYGYSPGTMDDHYVRIADEAAKLMGTLADIGGTFINILPFLRHIPSWVPGAIGKRKIEKLKKMTDEVKRIPLEYAKIAMDEGTALPSLVTNFLEKPPHGACPEKQEALINVAWSVCGGASDTISSTTRTFLHLMIAHPKTQKRAQEEIDRVIGHSRLPDFKDRLNLPYIDAIYREVLRYNPPAALGIPHALAEDDIYEGYLLPKGAVVIANIWAMAHDESVYPDPFSFKPDRFLNADGTLNDDSRVLAYGFGRRICVGRPVASSMMWLIIVSFLACFDIKQARDESDNEIEIDHTYIVEGMVTHKKPFACSIAPRSEQIRKLIESTLDL